MTFKEIKDYFKPFWRIKDIVIHDFGTDKSIEPGVVYIHIKSSLPLFGWDIIKLSASRPMGIQMFIHNDWWFGIRKFTL